MPPRPYWARIYYPVPSLTALQGTGLKNVKLQLPGTNGMPILSGLPCTPFLLVN